MGQVKQPLPRAPAVDLQGYLADKKPSQSRTLQEDYDQGPIGARR